MAATGTGTMAGAGADGSSSRLRSPSTAPGVRRARRFAIGGLLAAFLVAGVLALVFTVGGGRRDKAATAAAGTASAAGAAPGPVKSSSGDGATVTPLPLVGHEDHDHAAAASTTTITAPASTKQQDVATAASPQTTTTTTATPKDGMGLLQEALANNPLLSTAGDPLQTLGKAQQQAMGGMNHQGMNHDMEGMDHDMGDMDMGDDTDMGEAKAYLGESTCLVADIDELQDAVENGVCPLVVLTSAEKGAYMLMDMNEILVRRRVRVSGHPAMLPTIDAMMGMRAFTVGPGGYLELQFVRIVSSMGMYRNRYGLEGREGMGTQVLEVRGGGVMLEPGAEGANFVGVVFLMVNTDAEMVNMAIQDTLNLSGWRIYGGHVYVAAGTVRFLNCHFWDSMILMPFTDVVAFGADVLVVTGSVFFTGCTFTTTMLLCNYASAGWNIATLGGTTVVTFSTFQWQSLAMSMAVAGMVLFTGGGVTVLTGVDFRFVSPVMNFMGMGTFATGAGTLIMTGVTQEQAFACFSSFGVGMFNALGSGVMAEQGSTVVMFSGPTYQSMTGAVTFVGTGSSTHIGVPASMYGSTGTQHGQGAFSYNGAGVSVWVGCPLAMFWATYAFFGLGGVASHGAGIMVWVGNPIFMPMAISYFAGLGMVMFVGGGSAVLVGSPVAMPSALMAWSGPSMSMMTDDVMNPESAFGMMNHTTMEMDMGGMNMTMDHMMMEMPAMFWVQGNTEADGKGAAYVTGGGAVDYYPHPKWASHLLESDPEYNLWEYGMTNMTHRLRRAQSPSQSQSHKLSAAALTDALALFGSDPVGTPKLLAMGLDVNQEVDVSQPAVYDQFKGWVPGPMLDAAKEVAGLRARLQASDADLGRDEPATLRVDNALLDYCGVCETEGEVAGAGTEVCDVETSCQTLQARAPPAAQALFDYDEIAFDPQALVIADFRPTTAAGQALDPKAFQRALQGYLRANGTTGFQVTAFPALPSHDDYDFLPREASEQQRALLASSLANDEFPITHPIRAVFVTPDPAKAAALAAALEDPTSDSYADMELFVGDALASEAGVLVQALDASLAQRLTVPAYKSLDFTQAFADELDAAAGSNSVRLVDAANAGVPLARAVTGQQYAVKLGGFPANAKLTVQLLGQRDGRQTVASVKPLLAADRDGAATFTWTVPAALPTGDYYLKATDLLGRGFGLSPAFAVDTQRRRRLFGPSHEFYD